MEEAIHDIFIRTMNNCDLYFRKRKMVSLANEIGVLRGISYCIELMDGVNLSMEESEKYKYYLSVQQSLKEVDER